MKEKIKGYFTRLTDTIERLDIEEIEEAVMAIKAAYDREATIYIFGNGGSAATASHYVNDFNKGISENKGKKFNLICLNDNISQLTAIANDIGYEEVYRFPLKNKLKKEDLVIGISGSGNSKNVINAAIYAKEIGCKVIGITGYSGGELRQIADFRMHVNTNDMQLTEDIHMAFDHMMFCVLMNEIEN
ncbi:SIS domain-containing protein [Lachnospiraceae bacterium OttesenSCG-928-D06]|nr:SIS domain-containing protein [Lachnospiraceae bacterium OttesenSCG-928-D06]